MTGDGRGIFQPRHSFCIAAVAMSMSEFHAICGIKARVRLGLWGQPCAVTEKDYGGLTVSMGADYLTHVHSLGLKPLHQPLSP